MNTERLARLFRERAQLDLEIAEALLETEKKPVRRLPRARLGGVAPSPAAVETVRSALESQGVQSR